MILLLTDQESPRLHYVMQVLFDHWYPVGYRICRPTEAPSDFDGPVLGYGCQTPPSLNALTLDFHTPSCLSGLSPWLPNNACTRPEELPPAADRLGIDLPALLFFSLSRYEEYQPFSPDTHGRFPASASWAHRKGSLERPLVDHWSELLAKMIRRRWPRYPLPHPGYTFTATFDIDLPWAFLHRPAWLQGASLLKNLFTRPAWARAQWRSWLGRQPDPFDTFEKLKKLHPPEEARFFALYAPRGPYDRGGRPGSAAFQDLLRDLHRHGYEIGLHPSYRAAAIPDGVRGEKAALEKVLQQPVKSSRNHYLRLAFPQTYRQLLDAGLQEDWTMAYPDAPGFRAGTSRPFSWYDLEQEKTTPLKVQPACLMDVGLKDYCDFPPERALRVATRMIDQVRQLGGTFVPIWHNSSFSPVHGWEGWDRVYEEIMERARTGGPN